MSERASAGSDPPGPNQNPGDEEKKEDDKQCGSTDAGVPDAKPAPQKQCLGSGSCEPNQRCSTERGDCLAPVDENGNIMPLAVCMGICEPKVGECTSSLDCDSGERCSTERGECLGFPGADSGISGPAVCYGVCEKP